MIVIAMGIARLYGGFTPRHIARVSFGTLFFGTSWLASVVSNGWSAVPVIAEPEGPN